MVEKDIKFFYSVIPLAQQGVFINKFLQIETYKTPLKSPLLGGKGRSPGGYFQVSLLNNLAFDPR